MDILIYVAGPLSRGGKASYCEVVANQNAMTMIADRIFEHGKKQGRLYAVINPALDFTWQLVCANRYVEELQANTKAMLRRCDALYLMAKSEDSSGTQAELQQAKDRGQAIVHTFHDIDKLWEAKHGKA